MEDDHKVKLLTSAPSAHSQKPSLDHRGLSEHSKNPMFHVNHPKYGHMLVKHSASDISKGKIDTWVKTGDQTVTNANCFVTSGAKKPVDLYLRKRAFYESDLIVIRFKVTESGAANFYMGNIYNAFEQVEVYFNKAKGNAAQILNMEALRFFHEAFEDYDVRDNLAKVLGHSDMALRSDTLHESSQVRYYSIVFRKELVVNGWHVNGQSLNSDILIRLIPTGLGNVVSGSGTPTLSEIELFTYGSARASDMAQFEHSNHGRMFPYIDVFNITPTVVALAAETDKFIPLDGVTGDIAALLVVIRAANDTLAGRQKYVHLGDNAVIDVLDGPKTSSVSYINRTASQGIPAVLTQWEQYQRQGDFKQDWYSNGFYLLSFNDHLSGVLSGDTKYGWQHFTNVKENQQLYIRPDVAGQSQIVSFDLTGTAASGTYKIKWGDDQTEEDIAFDETAANMKIFIERIKCFRESNAFVTVSGPATADFTVTISNASFDFVDKYGLPEIILQDLATVAPAAIVVNDITVTTEFRKGFTAGSYFIDVYPVRLEHIASVVQSDKTVMFEIADHLNEE